jgi:hypothetical protein
MSLRNARHPRHRSTRPSTKPTMQKPCTSWNIATLLYDVERLKSKPNCKGYLQCTPKDVPVQEHKTTRVVHH